MAEYLIQEETLTALGDGVRGISGTTGAMSTETMTSHLVSANSTIDEQADLIAQIATVLEGKAAGGSGGSLETCTVTIYNAGNIMHCYACVYKDGTATVNYGEPPTDFTPYIIANVIVGSDIYLFAGDNLEVPESSEFEVIDHFDDGYFGCDVYRIKVYGTFTAEM